jgi:DNA-binding transcriptional ArsR family regulator
MAVRLIIDLELADLADVRFSVSPMQHLLFGAQHSAKLPRAAHWWRRVHRAAPQKAAPLIDLAGLDNSYVPDFLLPPLPMTGRAIHTIADELDAIRATAPAQIADEIARYDGHPHPPRSLLMLRDGDPRIVDRLADAAFALYRACLADEWPDLVRRLTTDVAHRRAALAEQGLGGMLAGLTPGWGDPRRLVLAYPDSPCLPPVVHARTAGHGLLLTPNAFLDRGWSTSVSDLQRATMIYPALSRTPAAPAAGDPLAVLIGRGRAAVLRSVGAGCTTGELAARLAVSAPTASVQAGALRAAGLVDSVRQGRKVVHTLTALGSGLLLANPEPAAVHR